MKGRDKLSGNEFNIKKIPIYIMEKTEYQELKDDVKSEEKIDEGENIPDIDSDSLYYLCDCCCHINWHHIFCNLNCLEHLLNGL